MNIIKKIKSIIEKYEISLLAASTSFYMSIAIFSLLILLVQFYNYFNTQGSIFNNIINELYPYYMENIEDIIPIFTLNILSPILLINLFWSASKYINGFNKASDIIYQVNKKRNFIINRINSFFILLLIVIILIVEVIIILFANKLLNIFNMNIIIYTILQIIIELFLIYSVIIIINYLVPPIKLKAKNVIKGSFISMVMIYILLIIFLFTIKVLKIFFLNIITIISLFFLLIYMINFSLIIGIYINYILQK